jgi:glycosyltransferase involved in cell wall biosynthesis
VRGRVARKKNASVKLSVLIPVWNEEESVEPIVRRVSAMDVAALGAVGAPVELEIIVVDDCSTDRTAGILARLEGAVPGLHVIQHGRNQGKGAGIRTALAAASGDYVIIQDADLEYDPADIPRLLAPVLRGEAEVVYGARPLDGSGGRWLMDFGNRALTVLTNLLYGTRLHDMETCYKLLPTALLRSFDLECSRFDMEPEITAKVTRSGYRIHEVPISYHPRPPGAGGKKLSARKDGLPALKALLRYRWWRPRAHARAAPRSSAVPPA